MGETLHSNSSSINSSISSRNGKRVSKITVVVLQFYGVVYFPVGSHLKFRFYYTYLLLFFLVFLECFFVLFVVVFILGIRNFIWSKLRIILIPILFMIKYFLILFSWLAPVYSCFYFFRTNYCHNFLIFQSRFFG